MQPLHTLVGQEVAGKYHHLQGKNVLRAEGHSQRPNGDADHHGGHRIPKLHEAEKTLSVGNRESRLRHCGALHRDKHGQNVFHTIYRERQSHHKERVCVGGRKEPECAHIQSADEHDRSDDQPSVHHCGGGAPRLPREPVANEDGECAGHEHCHGKMGHAHIFQEQDGGDVSTSDEKGIGQKRREHEKADLVEFVARAYPNTLEQPRSKGLGARDRRPSSRISSGSRIRQTLPRLLLNDATAQVGQSPCVPLRMAVSLAQQAHP
mmetsp:Transcript_12392/g.33442  ORF Transcript_12392/g.33442 Transcript_12392/m.33442 type:complete len:264 (-) Transcript_12392:87-878(-)